MSLRSPDPFVDSFSWHIDWIACLWPLLLSDKWSLAGPPQRKRVRGWRQADSFSVSLVWRVVLGNVLKKCPSQSLNCSRGLSCWLPSRSLYWWVPENLVAFVSPSWICRVSEPISIFWTETRKETYNMAANLLPTLFLPTDTHPQRASIPTCYVEEVLYFFFFFNIEDFCFFSMKSFSLCQCLLSLLLLGSGRDKQGSLYW